MGIDVFKVKLSKGYQITVPAKLREKKKLGIADEIELIDLGEDENIILRITKKKKDIKMKDLRGFCKVERKIDSVKEHDLIVSGEH